MVFPILEVVIFADLTNIHEEKLRCLHEEINRNKEEVYRQETEIDMLQIQIYTTKSRCSQAITDRPNENELASLMEKVCNLESGTGAP